MAINDERDSKEFAVKDAREYAKLINAPVYVWRRGNKYQASRNQTRVGWRLAEIVTPEGYAGDTTKL